MTRLIALIIVSLAGAIIASAGVIAGALPNARKDCHLDIQGLPLISLACLLFVVEWIRGYSTA